MFFWGIIAVLQVLFIPGLILIKLLDFKNRFVARLVAVVSSSLVVNYCLIFLLTALHIYVRTVLIGIVVCEIGVVAWLYKDDLNKSIETGLKQFFESFRKKIGEWKTILEPEKGTPQILYLTRIVYLCFSLVLAYVSIKWIIKLFVWNIGSVFDSYDTLKSWSKWAINWSNNMFPISTNRYPQLLPINWSILFTLVGDSSIQFFAKAIMPLFTLLILVMIVDLGFYKKNAGYFLGAAVTYLMLKKFLGSIIVEGYADLPSAFLAFSSIYLLFIVQDEKCQISKNAKYGVFIIISAAGCAVTKQAGLLFLFLFSLMFIRFFLKPLLKMNEQEGRKALIICLLLVACITVPWYLFKQIQIWQGLEKSEINMISGATRSAFGHTSLQNQFLEIGRMLGKYLYLLLFIIPMSVFMEPLVRSINFYLIVPIFISWSLFASYNFRNLSIALPLLGMSGGLSIQYVIDTIYKMLRKVSLKISLKHIFYLIVIVLVLIGVFIFPDNLMRLKQSELTMNTFSPTLNREIVKAIENDDGDFIIITNYPVESLPGMTGKIVNSLFNNYEDFEITIEFAESDNIYLLIPSNSNQIIIDEINEKINYGDYVLLFENSDWIPYMFIKINKK